MSAHGVQPSSWAYSAAIDAVSRLGRWERAIELLSELERPESPVRPESHCYAAAMRACLRAGSWRSVLELHDRMLAASVEPTPYTLVPVLSACAAEPASSDHGWRRAQTIIDYPIRFEFIEFA